MVMSICVPNCSRVHPSLGHGHVGRRLTEMELDLIDGSTDQEEDS